MSLSSWRMSNPQGRRVVAQRSTDEGSTSSALARTDRGAETVWPLSSAPCRDSIEVFHRLLEHRLRHDRPRPGGQHLLWDVGPIAVVGDVTLIAADRIDTPAVNVSEPGPIGCSDGPLEQPIRRELGDGVADLVLAHVGNIAERLAVHVHVERLAHLGELPGVGRRLQHPRSVDVDVTRRVRDDREYRARWRSDAPGGRYSFLGHAFPLFGSESPSSYRGPLLAPTEGVPASSRDYGAGRGSGMKLRRENFHRPSTRRSSSR